MLQILGLVHYWQISLAGVGRQKVRTSWEKDSLCALSPHPVCLCPVAISVVRVRETAGTTIRVKLVTWLNRARPPPPPPPLKAVRTAETHEPLALYPMRHYNPDTPPQIVNPTLIIRFSLLFSSRSRFTITHRPLHSCLDDNHQIAKPRNHLRQALRRNSTRDDNSRTLASLSSPAFKGLLVARDFEDPFLLGKHLTTQEDPVEGVRVDSAFQGLSHFGAASHSIFLHPRVCSA